jgi:hypothetical protein
VVEAVKRNEEWRGKRCLNLLAPEAPTSPTVRALLASEIGTRAAEGHIGRVNRWFAGTQHIDEVEALCVELLKRAFRCRYADHRLMAGSIRPCLWTGWLSGLGGTAPSSSRTQQLRALCERAGGSPLLTPAAAMLRLSTSCWPRALGLWTWPVNSTSSCRSSRPKATVDDSKLAPV